MKKVNRRRRLFFAFVINEKDLQLLSYVLLHANSCNI